jgi:hypothetical protein
VLTGSVQFWREGKSLIEFDGGLVRISARSGRMTFFGLESKSGQQNPYHSLRKRTKVLGIQGSVLRVSNDYAVLELRL